jgi:Methane oxygenase PmoA
MKRLLSSVAAMLLSASTAPAAAPILSAEIGNGKEDLKNAIVVVPLPKFIADSSAHYVPVVTTPDGKPLLAQFGPPRLLDQLEGSEVSILVPELKAGQKLKLKVDLNGKQSGEKAFSWGEADGFEQLSFDGKPVLRYFHKPFDASQSALVKGKPDTTTNPTIKPYHELFLADGKTIVTNSNQGKYPHHRGIFYGFNGITYDGKKADVWHCRTGEHTDHEKVLSAETGPLFGRHALQISWHGQDGKVFADEKRELTAYHLPGGTMIDFASELTTPLDKVHLDGDPQHAGFHFRANSAMEKDEKETVFIRPDGRGELGKEKNWDPKTKMGPVNLPWDAMSFMFEGKRYTVVYLDNPANPKEARDSERCYGRIGSYFVYDLTKDKPLKVHYRLWFQEGEPTVEQCEALSKAFTSAPAVAVK